MTSLSIQATFINCISKRFILITARYGHSVVLIRSKLMVIGGTAYNNAKTEMCELNDKNEWSCQAQLPALKDYDSYPLLFIANEDYVKC